AHFARTASVAGVQRSVGPADTVCGRRDPHIWNNPDFKEAARIMQPALFLSHGAPTLALDDSATGRFLDRFFDGRDRPDWVLVASAHDTSERPVLGAALRPKTVHDFGGFPDALYRIQYPASGAPERARQVAALLERSGLSAIIDEARGLDHGTWVP